MPYVSFPPPYFCTTATNFCITFVLSVVFIYTIMSSEQLSSTVYVYGRKGENVLNSRQPQTVRVREAKDNHLLAETQKTH